MNKKDYEQILKSLNNMRRQDADSWGLFFLGTQIYIGKTRVYKTKNNARRRIIEEFSHWPIIKDVAGIISSLEASGMLEIRTIGDRSPKYPHNVANIDKEQADRLVAMLDATDDEMCNLGILIIQGLKEKIHETED